jgi:hypothetical protein
MGIQRPVVPGWLLLVFTLPAQRASQRVKVWRKLQRYGTVPLGNSGYLLPSNPANEEHFEWLATSIRKDGGEASVVHVRSIDNISTSQLVSRFAEARAREYQELIREIQRFCSLPRQEKAAGPLSRMRSRFQEIVEVDFFGSPLQKRAAELLAQADAARLQKHVRPMTGLHRREFKRRTWVTRPRPGLDRSASAWLIQRYIDPKARFVFAAKNQVPEGAIPFDIFHGGGFGHRGEDCTFETLQKDFRIRDAKIKIVSEMIHDADLLDEKFGRKEGFGIDSVLKGWARQGVPDSELLARGIQLIAALYQSISRDGTREDLRRKARA